MDSTATVKTGVLERFCKEIVAGGLAGALGKSSVAPFERAKILIQTGRSPYARVDHVLHYIYKSEGVLGFFRGNGASVVRIVPYAALHYATYEHYRAALVSVLQRTSPSDVSASRPPIWVDLLAGSCSGATAVAVTYPLDLMRTRLAWTMDASSAAAAAPAAAPSTGRAFTFGAGRRSILQTMRAVVEEEGLRGLYRGCTPTLLGILPYAGIKFYTYQSLKRLWADHHAALAHLPHPSLDDSLDSHHAPAPAAPPQRHPPHAPAATARDRPPLVMSLLFGATAGLVAQTLTYPLDIVRRRMQVSNLRGGPEGAHATVLGTARAIVQEFGWRGLFRGVTINYIKVTPATAVGFTVYDQLKVMLGLENHL
eukprot:jgi/Ulvmu1/2230/UM013_0077.1